MTNRSDVESIGAIITAAYDVISGPAGKKRDWKRERSLFIRGARLIPTTKRAGGTNKRKPLKPQFMNVEAFIRRSRDYVERNGFFEKEIARRVEQFGQIAHVWSTYESRHTEEDTKPFMRGINPESGRGWIVNIFWQHETKENSIPRNYLRSRRSRKATQRMVRRPNSGVLRS